MSEMIIFFMIPIFFCCKDTINILNKQHKKQESS